MKKLSLFIFMLIFASFIVACGDTSKGEADNTSTDAIVEVVHNLGTTVVPKKSRDSRCL